MNPTRLSHALSKLSRAITVARLVGVRIRVLSKRASKYGAANSYPQAVHSLKMGLLDSVGRSK